METSYVSPSVAENFIKGTTLSTTAVKSRCSDEPIISRSRHVGASNIKVVEIAALEELSHQLSNLDMGDRMIRGRLQLFSVPTTNQPTQSADDWSSSGNDVATRGLLATLVGTMNKSFPDYDFSTLCCDNFVREDLTTAVNVINQQLGMLVERLIPGFTDTLWDTIRDCLDIPSVCLYSFVPPDDLVDYLDPLVDAGLNPHCSPTDTTDHPPVLSFFDYFFYDKTYRRILFLGVAIQRLSEMTSGSSERSHLSTTAPGPESNCQDLDEGDWMSDDESPGRREDDLALLNDLDIDDGIEEDEDFPVYSDEASMGCDDQSGFWGVN